MTRKLSVLRFRAKACRQRRREGEPNYDFDDAQTLNSVTG
jgi:hypothetical protein